MSRFDELRKRKEEAFEDVNSEIKNLRNLAFESKRVANVSHNSKMIIDNIDERFSKLTKLNKVDISFLFVATALQCLRQYIFTNDSFRFDKASDGDKFIEKLVPKRYEDILLQSVPYDAFRKLDGTDISAGVSGANHRYTTLGHDPLLGWVFGSLNILTDSLTKNNFNLESFSVVNSNFISERVPIVQLFNEGANYASKDYKLVVASVMRQAVHFGADAFTKMGLPIPIINTVSPDLSSKLLSKQCRIDLYSVSRGVMLSTLVNTIISAVHGLFYNPNDYESRDMYDVKTRKILSYSNALATSSNIIYTVLTENYTKLDVGGFIVTVYRLVNDYKFIKSIKQEFVMKEFDKLIQG